MQAMALLLIFFLFSSPFLSSINAQHYTINTSGLNFANNKLKQAYIALQTWKQTAIFSDPHNFTANWVGEDVCSYLAVFCATSPYHPHLTVIAAIDLNHAHIAGYLPTELGLLTDLTILHLNSNRFCGTVPQSFSALHLLRELDISNNRFAGPFPEVLLSLPSLSFLDMRFNEFEGAIPPAIFEKTLDAIFLNSNRFSFGIPANLGASPASVIVLANNDLGGCIPSSISEMGDTLNEIVLLNNNLTACIPSQIGNLNSVTVFDVSFNELQGPLPETVAGMKKLEQLDVAHNRLTGKIPAAVCELPRLKNFTYSYNFFTGMGPRCSGLGAHRIFNGMKNCFAGRTDQRPKRQCTHAAVLPFDCTETACTVGQSKHNYTIFSPPPPPKKAVVSRRVGPRPPSPTRAPTRGQFVLVPPPPPQYGTSPSMESHPPPPELSIPPVIGVSYTSPPPPVVP